MTMIIDKKFGRGLMIAVGLVAMLSGCQSKQSADTSKTDKTHETADYNKFADKGTAEDDGTEEDDSTAQSTETAKVVPIAVTIEQVTDTISEDKGSETYKYPKFYLDEEAKTAYPGLNKAFENHNRKAESEKKTVLEGLKSGYDEFMENYQGDDISIQMTSEATATALRADSNVVSILCEHFDYLGGAHGYYYTGGINFDAKTGDELTLADVVEDKDRFIALVSETFVKDYSGKAGYDSLMDPGEVLKERNFDSNEDILWSIDPTCVSIYFAPYVLGTYAHGEQVVSIYFDEAPEIFNEAYTVACEDYVLPVTDWKPLSILSSSGKREKINAELQAVQSGDDDWCWYKVLYTIGDTSVSSQYNCYGADIYLAHVNGKNYIYSFQSTDNDETFLSVVDADEMTLDDEKNIGVCRKEYYKSNDTNDGYEVIQGGIAFTDPSKFELGFSVDILGTYHVYSNYHIGEDGYPVSDDKLYTADPQTAFRAIRDIECDTVDKEGNVTGKATIPAGSFLAVVRTDAENIADIQIVDSSYVEKLGYSDWTTYLLTMDIEEIMDMDKTIYRVTTDNHYPFKVNGEDEESIFEGVSRSS